MKMEKVLTIMMVVMLLAGCGSNPTEETVKETNTINSEVHQDTETVESSVEVKQEEVVASPEPVDVNSLIVEKTNEELNLKKYFLSYEDRTMDEQGEQVFYENLFELNPKSFKTTGNIDIYNINGIRVGYTLEDVVIETFGEYEGWYFFYIEGNKRFARVEAVKANSTTKEQAQAEESATKEETEKQEQSTVKTETPVQVPSEEVTDAPPVSEPVEVPIESDKYTPEEAIAVYRAGMEAGGIVWNPELKGVTSWGTGFIYLDKGYPELVASSNLESFAMGDSGGNPWTEYYFEVTGFDEEAVYITEWHN